MAEILTALWSILTWKIESIPNKVEWLAKGISKQNFENAN